jgi:acetylornithine/N-succinyldiaminopimelate aminotransferase
VDMAIAATRSFTIVIRRPSSVVRHSSFVIRHSSFVIRHSPSQRHHANFTLPLPMTASTSTEPLGTEQLFAEFVLPTYGRFPISLVRGEGSRVWDENGKEYLDFGAGIAVCSLGHAHPRLVDALIRQAKTLGHTSNLYYTRSQGLLAQKIVSLVGAPGRCFFCNSGAEANEALYKLARRFGNQTRPGGRHEIITFEQSFHGRTLAGLAATGQEKVRVGFEPLTPGFTQAIFNDLASVEAKLNERTAAILLEPIQGESGIVSATPEFLRGLRRLCDDRNLLLFFDEVQCGFGRTGDWCAWRSLGASDVLPDGVSWAKGMAGGFPMGAIWARDRPITLLDGTESKLGSLFGPGSHGTTFGGNPLCCAAALATFEVIEEEELLSNAASIGEYARTLLAGMVSPLIAHVRGLGLMLGIEIDGQAFARTAAARHDPRAPALQVVSRLQQGGLLTVPSGAHVIRWLPPLNVSGVQVEQAVRTLATVLKSFTEEAA